MKMPLSILRREIKTFRTSGNLVEVPYFVFFFHGRVEILSLYLMEVFLYRHFDEINEVRGLCSIQFLEREYFNSLLILFNNPVFQADFQEIQS